MALLVIGLLGSFGLRATEISVAANQLPIALGQYLDYLEDTTGQLTIEQLLRNPQGYNWQRSRQNIPTLGISNSTHWFFLTIQPRGLSETTALALTIDSPIIDNIEVFTVQGNQVLSHTRLGDTVPLSQIDLPLRVPAMRLDGFSAVDDLHIYFRVASSSGIEFPLTIVELEQLLVEQQGELAYFGAFFAFLVLCIGLSAVIFWYLRDSLFLAITLFFVFGFAFFLCLTGMGRLWFWGESTELNTRIVFVSGAMLIFSFALIGRKLDLKSRLQDSINLVLRILAFGMLAVAAYFLLIPFEKLSRETILPLMIMGAVIALVVMTMAGIAAVRGSRTAIYLFLSWALMLLSYLLTLFYKFSIIERTTLITTFGQACFVIAALLLLASLGEFIRNKSEDYQSARSDARAKTDFLRNVSKEILTPVHLVLANSKRLLSSSPEIQDEKTRGHIATIIKQSNYLHTLINDLLEMAELESDSFEPAFELVEMSRFLNETRDMARKTAEEKGLTLTSNYSSANLLLQTDRARLQHVLLKLISNAIRFTDKGSVTLSYKAIYFQRHLGIEISVKDTGQGMSEEFKQQLFHEFSREHPAPELEPEGTGLGLVIVKRMLEKLGGEIHFESRLTRGTEFIIRLPLRRNGN